VPSSQSLRNATLGVNTFEVADQEQPEIDVWWQAGPADRLGVEAGALRLGEIVEPVIAEQLIQSQIDDGVDVSG